MTKSRTPGRTARATRALLVGGALVGVAGTAAHADPKNRDSYTFEGLQWGLSLQEARTELQKRGYSIVGVVRGARREFVPVSLTGEHRMVDRGARLVASGRYIGERAVIELAFGAEDKLNTVLVKPPKWNRNSADTQRIINTAEKFVEFHEDKHGEAKKWRDTGWTDTAEWNPARDGSTIQVFVRGVKGFTFSPSYDTFLKVRYSSPRFVDNKSVALQQLIKRPSYASQPLDAPTRAGNR